MKKIVILISSLVALSVQASTTLVYYPESQGLEILQTTPIDYLGVSAAYEGKNTYQDITDKSWQQTDPDTQETSNHRYIQGHKVLEQYFVGPLYHYKDIQATIQLGAYKSDKACSYYYINDVLQETDCQSKFNQAMRVSQHYSPSLLKGATISVSYSSPLDQPTLGIGWRF